MHVIFFDTETTGKNADDRLCQLAYSQFFVNGEELELVTDYNYLFKTEKPIGIEAMSVHHITNKQVADRPLFKESPAYKDIKELFEKKDTIVVAHNAKFDMDMLAREDIKPHKVICTLKLARSLDPDGVIPSYKLQYLRYLLDLEVEADAHDAMGDVRVLRKLFDRLYTKMLTMQQFSVPFPMPQDYYEDMVRISSQPTRIVKFQFGKYQGKTIEEVAKTDHGYIEWLHRSESGKPAAEQDGDMLYTLKKYL